MAHIDLPSGYPGIRSLFMYSPATAMPLNNLVQILLHDPGTSTLSPGERELIAAYTSRLNECTYCARTHGAIAQYQLDGDAEPVRHILACDVEGAPVSKKMKALLRIAAAVQAGGQQVRSAHIGQAREEGATDREIHDTVLIAAAFCMFNRYVDGLATWAPKEDAVYDAIGRQRAAEGYLTKPFTVPENS